MTRPTHRVAIVGWVLLALVALAGPMLLFARAGRSSASFGDGERLGINHLGAATLDIEIGEQSTPLSASTMAPGDTATGWLDLANAGDLDLRYALVADNGTGMLLDWLRWDVWRAVGSCDTAPAPAGRLVADESLRAGASQPLLGNAAFGLDPGDRILEPDEAERICIAATLPAEAPNELQGQSVTQDLRVVAEHHLEDDGR